MVAADGAIAVGGDKNRQGGEDDDHDKHGRRITQGGDNVVSGEAHGNGALSAGVRKNADW